jgi:hypothetical protein
MMKSTELPGTGKLNIDTQTVNGCFMVAAYVHHNLSPEDAEKVMRRVEALIEGIVWKALDA